jgi:hypothetical protein
MNKQDIGNPVQILAQRELLELECTKLNFNRLVFEVLRLRREKNEYVQKSIFYQEEVLKLQDRVLNHYGIENRPYMKVAD